MMQVLTKKIVHSRVNAKLVDRNLNGCQLHRPMIAQLRIASKPRLALHPSVMNNGLSLRTIGQLLGHSSEKTTARYAHFADQTLTDAMQLIGDKIKRKD